MLKVLIADDEYRICHLINSIIDWEKLGMKVVAMCQDGVEALDNIKSLSPDIVITDIRMPGHDGIELIDICSEFEKRPEFIIISGYRHFEYARSAIKYGVNDYLLKPIKKSELNATLKKISDQYMNLTKDHNSETEFINRLKNDDEVLRNMYISSLLYRESQKYRNKELKEINSEFHYHMREGLFAVSIIKLDGNTVRESTDIDFILANIAEKLKTQLSDCVFDHAVMSEDNCMYILLNFSNEYGERIKKELKTLFEELLIKKSMFYNLKVTMSLSEFKDDVNAFENLLKSAKYLIEDRIIQGTDKFISNNERKYCNLTETHVFTEFNKDIMQALESMNELKVRRCIRRLKEQITDIKGITGHDIIQMTKEVCNLYIFFIKRQQLFIENNFLEEYNNKVQGCCSMDELFDHLLSYIGNAFEKAVYLKKQEENKPVRLAKEYIKENYQKSISLEDVSTYAGLSAAYLSTVFKKETGVSFLEYLSKHRIDKAKQLLKETSLSVAAVCEEVGYTDLRHFTKTFVKYAELKPNEYRKLYS
jgi:hypothetical protein